MSDTCPVNSPDNCPFKQRYVTNWFGFTYPLGHSDWYEFLCSTGVLTFFAGLCYVIHFLATVDSSVSNTVATVFWWLSIFFAVCAGICFLFLLFFTLKGIYDFFMDFVR